MIIILRTTADIMIQATILFPNYRVSRALRFSSACPCPRSPFLSFPRVLSFHHTLFLLSSRALSFFRNFAKASARASPRKASSRAIPVITTTSIFVKSLSPLSLSPSLPPSPSPSLLTPSPPTIWSFDLPLYKPGRPIPDENRQPPAPSPLPRDIFQIINFYDWRA